MQLIKTADKLKSCLSNAGRREKSLGLVPTMGYLHEGHISLIERAKKENNLVVVSIFVNPTQFGPNEDFEKYPRDLERDMKLAAEAGADFVFNPEVAEMYPSGASTAVEVGGYITKKLCGASRPTHFKGVTTVVNMLFNITGPDRAYFGQKDAQQAVVIKKMVRDLHMPVEIIVCPIVRESDGLARSSRNVYLNKEERAEAPSLNRALEKAEEFLRSGSKGSFSTEKLIKTIEDEIEKQPLAKIDYVSILDGETLEDIECIVPGRAALAAVAVRFGNTRLIDNRLLLADL